MDAQNFNDAANRSIEILRERARKAEKLAEKAAENSEALHFAKHSELSEDFRRGATINHIQVVRVWHAIESLKTEAVAIKDLYGPRVTKLEAIRAQVDILCPPFWEAFQIAEKQVQRIRQKLIDLGILD